ncbi:MAG: hypothetical protein MUF16_26175 [Burkholderiaceae bacterium]|nr:hypothetical protein [Burkholderiaceae bacterium]
MAASSSEGAGALLKLPAELLDQITALLSKVGLDLSPLTLQLFLLALVAALLVPTIKKLRARKKADRAPLINVVVLALVAAGVLIGLLENATTPTTVRGTLASDRLHSVEISLLDFRDQVISFGDSRPDTLSGVFVLHYKPLVDGRARKLRVTAPGCKPHESALARAQLRAETRITRDYTCVPG